MTNDQLTDSEIERLVREADQALGRDAKIPSAGFVYWRASIRARSEAARKVEQPLTIVQGLAIAAVLGVGAALTGAAWKSFSPLTAFEALKQTPLTALALLVAALVVIAPLALVALGSRMRFDRPQD